MEETKEQQSLYIFFRILIYISVLMEFFMFLYNPADTGAFNGFIQMIYMKLYQFGIYQNLIYHKLSTVLFIFLTCIGTVNRKQIEFEPMRMIILPLGGGIALIAISVILYMNTSPISLAKPSIWLYILCSIAGTLLMNIALDNIAKYFKDGMMKDRFNLENESFEQTQEKVETKYSVNIPMRFYYKGKFRHGWVNIVNPFRGTWVVGTPGSGKTFSVIEPFIRQHSAKGFAMVVYDFKFPTLAQKLYYHYRINKARGNTPKGCKFNVINFVDVRYSRRVNPIQSKYIGNLAAAQETAETLISSLQKGKNEGGGGNDNFFQTSATNFLAACIYFFVNYKREPYANMSAKEIVSRGYMTEQQVRDRTDKYGVRLYAEKSVDPETFHEKLTGRVYWDVAQTVVADINDWHWHGKYSDMPHVLSFLNHDYEEIFEVLQTDSEVYPLLGPFMTAFNNKAMEQLEGMIGTLRVQISRLATKEAYWVFSGDDFDLKVSDPKAPSYLLIANDPEMEGIIGALNAMILNRLVTRVNSGQGKNIPVSIIVDELPTLYFHKIDRLIGTARSNKVSVALGFQELPQLEADYGKVGMQKIITTVGNVVSGSARSKETLDWLSNDIFGKITQLKKGLSIDRDKTSISINEEKDSLVPASKISDMPTGWICGQTARDFMVTKTGFRGSMNIQESGEFQTSKFYCKSNFNMAEIKAEEADYKNYPLPMFYTFKDKEGHDSLDVRERVLYSNFDRINDEVNKMFKEVFQEFPEVVRDELRKTYAENEKRQNEAKAKQTAKYVADKKEFTTRTEKEFTDRQEYVRRKRGEAGTPQDGGPEKE